MTVTSVAVRSLAALERELRADMESDLRAFQSGVLADCPDSDPEDLDGLLQRERARRERTMREMLARASRYLPDEAPPPTPAAPAEREH